MTTVTANQQSNTDVKLDASINFKAIFMSLVAAGVLACWSGGDHSV